jgi:hypothetical protein
MRRNRTVPERVAALFLWGAGTFLMFPVIVLLLGLLGDNVAFRLSPLGDSFLPSIGCSVICFFLWGAINSADPP